MTVLRLGDCSLMWFAPSYYQLPSIHPAPHTQTCDFFQPFGTLWSKLKKNNMAKKNSPSNAKEHPMRNTCLREGNQMDGSGECENWKLPPSENVARTLGYIMFIHLQARHPSQKCYFRNFRVRFEVRTSLAIREICILTNPHWNWLSASIVKFSIMPIMSRRQFGFCILKNGSNLSYKNYKSARMVVHPWSFKHYSNAIQAFTFESWLIQSPTTLRNDMVRAEKEEKTFCQHCSPAVQKLRDTNTLA